MQLKKAPKLEKGETWKRLFLSNADESLGLIAEEDQDNIVAVVGGGEGKAGVNPQESYCLSARSFLSSIGSSMLLLGENFSRVHVGFWQAYSSIREDLLSLLVKYIVAHRMRYIKSRELMKSDVESQHHQPLNDHVLMDFLDISFCGHSLGGAIGSKIL